MYADMYFIYWKTLANLQTQEVFTKVRATYPPIYRSFWLPVYQY